MLDPLIIDGSEAAGNQKRPVHSLYGLTLASDFPFVADLPEVRGAPDITFDLAETPPATSWESYEPVFASPIRLDSGESLVYVYRQADYDVLRFTEVADFYLWPDHITCHLVDPAYDYVVEIYLLGMALSLWLERQGIPALHASAVVVEERAAAFLATNSGGKSSLAAALMQAGYPLLTDDILPIVPCGEDFEGRPGYPNMRMWPEQALHFLGYYEDLPIVHPAYSKRHVPVGENGLGTFCDRSKRLSCLYLPERRKPTDWGTRIEITSVSRREGLMELVKQSFLTSLLEAVGLQADRLQFFARMVSQIPMRKVVYPEGFEHLPDVRRAILDDLAEFSS